MTIEIPVGRHCAHNRGDRPTPSRPALNRKHRPAPCRAGSKYMIRPEVRRFRKTSPGRPCTLIRAVITSGLGLATPNASLILVELVRRYARITSIGIPSRSGNSNCDRKPETKAEHPMRLTVLSLCTLLSTTPAFAAGAGAIAWDRHTGKYGASFNQSTRRNAEDAAIGECGDSGCRVIMRIKPRMCAAFAATTDGKKAGAAVRKNR
jgi:hypothetical protein